LKRKMLTEDAGNGAASNRRRRQFRLSFGGA
jgi:hypothetical protein